MRLPLILYIEDSPFYQKMLRDIITSDYELHIADTGASGIIQTLSVLPDIIFLDVQLPDARGPELIKTIRAYLPKCTIIMVTSDNSAQTVNESKVSGANNYIIKPFSVSQINKHLEKWQTAFKNSPRPISTPEIIKKIAELTQEKDASETLEKKDKYQVWMEKKLPPTLPFVFIEMLDLPVIYNNAKQMCTTILAFSLEFNGEINCIGCWNQLKSNSTLSSFLIKSIIKNLKSRELNDIYTLILDPKLIEFSPEFASSYVNTTISQRIIPYHEIFYSSDIEVKMIGRKLILIPSFMDFEKSLEMLNLINSTLVKGANEVRTKLSLDLLKVEHLFSYPPEIRSIVLDTRWLIIVINHFLSFTQRQGVFDSVQSMQLSILTKFGEKNINKIYDLLIQKDDCVYTKKDYKEAIFIFSQLLPERFPETERFV